MPSALRRLQDGGRLVAIVSEAMSLHHSSFSSWYRRIACLCNIRANLTLYANEYAKCRAAPNVQILVIDKTGPTPGTNWLEQLEHISWGSAATVEEAWQVLQHLVGTTEPTIPEELNGHLFVPAMSAAHEQPTDMQLALDFKRRGSH